MKTNFIDTTTNNVLGSNITEKINDAKTINLIINNNTKQRTKCEIYTRVMGYFRPVSQFNIGKKSEFYSRKYFEEDISCNSQFIADYKN